MKFIVLVVTLVLVGTAIADNVDVEKMKVSLAQYRAEEATNWAAKYLADVVKIPGEYYLQKVVNLSPKVGQTNEFKMALEIAIKQDKQILYKLCDVEVIDSAITNSRWFNSNSVQCKDKPKSN